MTAVSPTTLTCIVETPKGSRNKYEYDESTTRMTLNRVLPSALVFPVDYGFIPETLSGDGDPLDVLVCESEPTFPGCAVTVRAVAVLRMRDEHGVDEKIVGVPDADTAWADVTDVDDLPEHLRDEITQFFSTYKELEPDRYAMTHGWGDRAEAVTMVTAARGRYSGEVRSKEAGTMATKQSEAAKRNIKKAQQAAKSEHTISHLPESTRRELGKQGARAARRGGSAGHSLEDRSRQQLYELAKENDIRGRSTMGKADLIKAIRKAA